MQVVIRSRSTAASLGGRVGGGRGRACSRTRSWARPGRLSSIGWCQKVVHELARQRAGAVRAAAARDVGAWVKASKPNSLLVAGWPVDRSNAGDRVLDCSGARGRRPIQFGGQSRPSMRVVLELPAIRLIASGGRTPSATTLATALVGGAGRSEKPPYNSRAASPASRYLGDRQRFWRGGEAVAAGDQHQRSGRAGRQRADLLAAGRVIQ